MGGVHPSIGPAWFRNCRTNCCTARTDTCTDRGHREEVVEPSYNRSMGTAGQSPWWARYSSPSSVDSTKKPAHHRVPSSLLLRLFNVLLVLSCSPVGSITAHGAVAGSKVRSVGEEGRVVASRYPKFPPTDSMPSESFFAERKRRDGRRGVWPTPSNTHGFLSLHPRQILSIDKSCSGYV